MESGRFSGTGETQPRSKEAMWESQFRAADLPQGLYWRCTRYGLRTWPEHWKPVPGTNAIMHADDTTTISSRTSIEGVGRRAQQAADVVTACAARLKNGSQGRRRRPLSCPGGCAIRPVWVARLPAFKWRHTPPLVSWKSHSSCYCYTTEPNALSCAGRSSTSSGSEAWLAGAVV